ncbi:MAG: tetratricopeptide repeat protein, partial [Gemmatimonadaceae bacterium]
GAAVVGWLGYRAATAVGNTWLRFAVDGTSTPYKEQYSYQQALVMQGRLDDALESFEAVIAEQPAAIDARLRAAELYARDKGNHARAAELFRQVQRIESVSAGEFVLATNRLVDLLSGPLGESGRALVELRRLIERYPSLPAAEHARAVLRRMKTAESEL